MRAFLIGLGLSISLGLALLASGVRADPPSYAQTVAVCGTPNNTPVALHAVGTNDHLRVSCAAY